MRHYYTIQQKELIVTLEFVNCVLKANELNKKMNQKVTYFKTLASVILNPSKSWTGLISKAKAILNNRLMVIPCCCSNNLRMVFSSQ